MYCPCYHCPSPCVMIENWNASNWYVPEVKLHRMRWMHPLFASVIINQFTKSYLHQSTSTITNKEMSKMETCRIGNIVNLLIIRNVEIFFKVTLCIVITQWQMHSLISVHLLSDNVYDSRERSSLRLLKQIYVFAPKVHSRLAHFFLLPKNQWGEEIETHHPLQGK